MTKLKSFKKNTPKPSTKRIKKWSKSSRSRSLLPPSKRIPTKKHNLSSSKRMSSKESKLKCKRKAWKERTKSRSALMNWLSRWQSTHLVLWVLCSRKRSLEGSILVRTTLPLKKANTTIRMKTWVTCWRSSKLAATTLLPRLKKATPWRAPQHPTWPNPNQSNRRLASKTCLTKSIKSTYEEKTHMTNWRTYARNNVWSSGRIKS